MRRQEEGIVGVFPIIIVTVVHLRLLPSPNHVPQFDDLWPHYRRHHDPVLLLQVTSSPIHWPALRKSWPETNKRRHDGLQFLRPTCRRRVLQVLHLFRHHSLPTAWHFRYRGASESLRRQGLHALQHRPLLVLPCPRRCCSLPQPRRAFPRARRLCHPFGTFVCGRGYITPLPTKMPIACRFCHQRS